MTTSNQSALFQSLYDIILCCKLVSLNWALLGLFFLWYCLSLQFFKQLVVNEICWWLDSNRRSLVLETTSLPNAPQPLPFAVNCYFPYLWVFSDPTLTTYLFYRVEKNPFNQKECFFKRYFIGAMVVAQFVEQSLPTPEIRRSNPMLLIHSSCSEKTKI